VVDLRDQLLQLLAASIELGEQLIRALGWLLALLRQNAGGQAVLQLRDPLLEVRPTLRS
jgi:hypothetical protein